MLRPATYAGSETLSAALAELAGAAGSGGTFLAGGASPSVADVSGTRMRGAVRPQRAAWTYRLRGSVCLPQRRPPHGAHAADRRPMQCTHAPSPPPCRSPSTARCCRCSAAACSRARPRRSRATSLHARARCRWQRRSRPRCVANRPRQWAPPLTQTPRRTSPRRRSGRCRASATCWCGARRVAQAVLLRGSAVSGLKPAAALPGHTMLRGRPTQGPPTPPHALSPPRSRARCRMSTTCPTWATSSDASCPPTATRATVARAATTPCLCAAQTSTAPRRRPRLWRRA